MNNQTWDEVYQALLQERDRARFRSRTDEAERAIKERLRQLLQEGGESTAERQALSSALHNIGILKNATLSED
jgi:hypothetical protein